MQCLTSHLCLIPFRDFHDKVLQPVGVRGAGIKALLCFGNSSTQLYMSQDVAKKQRLCLMENDAISFLTSESWRYKM